MHFNRKTVILVLFAALCGTASSAAADTPGSGTAVIAPSTDVTAGTQGTWTLTYTAAEPFSSGLVKYTIPTGWTTPQNSSSTSAGYITATSDDPSAVLGISVAGQIVSVTTTVLATGKTISLLYGDTGGGANPTAKASAPTAPASGVTFLVESDSQSGNNPAPIASSPSVNIVAGSPFSLDLSPADTTATAGDFIRLTIASVDIYGNRTAVSATRTFLLSSAPSGQFFATSNHSTPHNLQRLTYRWPGIDAGGLQEYRCQRRQFASYNSAQHRHPVTKPVRNDHYNDHLGIRKPHAIDDNFNDAGDGRRHIGEHGDGNGFGCLLESCKRSDGDVECGG